MIHNVSTTTCDNSITMSIEQHSLAGSPAGNVLDGSRRCKRCSHSRRDSHMNSDADSNHNTCSFLCIHMPRRSDDMCCIKHYCDHNSGSSRQQSISLENIASAEVANRVEKESASDTNDAGAGVETVEAASSVTSSSPAVCGKSPAVRDEPEDGHHRVRAAENPGSGDNCGGDDDDEDSSNSATSMLRNKKKPRSRLKKFLTSLLSLSSSSSDEEH